MALVSSLSPTSGLGRYAALFRAPSVPQVVVAGLLGAPPARHGPDRDGAARARVPATRTQSSAASSPRSRSRAPPPRRSSAGWSTGSGRRACCSRSRSSSRRSSGCSCCSRTGTPRRCSWSHSPLRPAATLPPIGACIRTLWPSMLPAHGPARDRIRARGVAAGARVHLGPVLVGGLAALASASVGDARRGRARTRRHPLVLAHAARAGRARPSGHRHALATRRARLAGSPHGDPRVLRARLRVRSGRGDDARVRRGARDARRRRVRARLLRGRLADRRHLERHASGARAGPSSASR